MRRTHPAFRMATTEQVAANLKFIDSPEGTIMYTINGAAVGDTWNEVLVIYNGNREGVDMVFPEGDWNIVCEDAKMQLYAPRSFKGGDFYVHGTSAIIAYK